jgi:hypothetical protein
MKTQAARTSMLQRCVATTIAVLLTLLVAHRIWRYATFDSARTAMPAALADAEELNLFQTAAGKYSLADIAANGPLLPSQKYRGFRAQHDYSPQPGERVCPITRTKANPNCTWIVAGESYEFCCPPCIAEFVRTAKLNPAQVLPAEEYLVPDR